MIRAFPNQEDLVLSPAVNGVQATDQDHAQMTLDFVYDLRREFEARDKLFDQIDACIYLQQKVNIPENFKMTAVEVRSPLPTHIANSIAAALSINVPKVIFDPIEFGDVGQDHAAYRGAYFQNSWQRQQVEKNRQLYRLFMYSTVTKGIGILKTTERKRRVWAKYSDFSEDLLKTLDIQEKLGQIDYDSRSRIFDGKTEAYKKGLRYPIETNDIPPETFYYQMGEDGFVRCAEVKNVPYYDTLKRYNLGLDSKGRVTSTNAVKNSSFDNMTGSPLPEHEWHKVFGASDRRYIQMIEVWDCWEQTIILRGPGDIPARNAGFTGTGLLVKRVPHNYGDLALGTLTGPYFVASGIDTPSRKHEYANMSTLFPYLHLFPLLNSLLTIQSQAAFSTGFPAYKRTTPPTFGLAETPFGYDAKEIHENRRQIVPGAIFPSDIMAMDQPRSSIDLDKAIQFVRALIERALPDSVQGVITGETAGYALNQASHLASLAWSPITTNAETALSNRVAHESRLIECNIGEVVYVEGALPRPKNSSRGSGDIYKSGWIGMGPKQLQGIHHYKVQLTPASINNDTLELRNLREELDMRLIAPDEAVRKRGRNPVDVERAWLLYELKQDDVVRNQLKQRIFQQLGTVDRTAMQAIPPEGQPNAAPPVPTSGAPAGAAPGVPQGLPTTGFVPPAGSIAPAAPPQAPQPPPSEPAQPNSLPRSPGTPVGAPGGVRGAPALHSPIPGG